MSYTSLAYHIVFSTKERRALLDPDVLPRICEYLGGIVRQTEGQMLIANGTADHLHLVAIASPKIAVSDFVRVIKANSSKWIHETFPNVRMLAWQDGYGAFSVSHSAIPAVVPYIRDQQKHHEKMTFREELKRLLDRHKIEYDERYLDR